MVRMHQQDVITIAYEKPFSVIIGNNGLVNHTHDDIDNNAGKGPALRNAQFSGIHCFPEFFLGVASGGHKGILLNPLEAANRILTPVILPAPDFALPEIRVCILFHYVLRKVERGQIGIEHFAEGDEISIACPIPAFRLLKQILKRGKNDIMVENVVELLDVAFSDIDRPVNIILSVCRNQVDGIQELGNFIAAVAIAPGRTHKQHIAVKVSVEPVQNILVGQSKDDFGLEV